MRTFKYIIDRHSKFTLYTVGMILFLVHSNYAKDVLCLVQYLLIEINAVIILLGT